MSTTTETAASIEAALLEGASVRQVLELRLGKSGDDLVVGVKIDLDEALTMKEVSAILLRAKRRVMKAVPEAKIVFIEPDVWIDPDAVQPTTSSVVMLGLD